MGSSGVDQWLGALRARQFRIIPCWCPVGRPLCFAADAPASCLFRIGRVAQALTTALCSPQQPFSRRRHPCSSLYCTLSGKHNLTSTQDKAATCRIAAPSRRLHACYQMLSGAARHVNSSLATVGLFPELSLPAEAAQDLNRARPE